MKFFKYIFFVAFFITVTSSFALPRLAVRLNDQCIDCHVNPTGGTMRNTNGWYYGKLPMSMISPREKELKLSPNLNDNISFGLDMRGQFLYSQERKKTDFQDMTAGIYGNVKLSDKIDIVARYDFVQAIWEGYGIARILPLNGYIKGGKFTPNFGIRLDDHTAYTRGGDFALLRNGGVAGLPYGPFYLETGMEVGFYLDKLAFFTASIGRPSNNFTFEADPSYTARLEITPTTGRFGLMFGGSYANSKTRGIGFPPKFNNTDTYGGFIGLGYDRFALLAEYDIADNYVAKDVKSTAIMAKFSAQLMTGLEAIVRYDKFDPNGDLEKDELSHLIFGLEFFPYSFVELRPQYRIHLEDPSVDNDAFVMQFHFWY